MFYEGLNTKSVQQASYNIFFLVRRAVTMCILVFMNHSPQFCTHALMHFSLGNFFYIVVIKPIQNKYENMIEAFNEVCILATIYGQIVLMNGNMSTELRDGLGWWFIGVVCTNIVTNLAITVKGSCKESYSKYRHKQTVKLANKVVAKKLENRRILA